MAFCFSHWTNHPQPCGKNKKIQKQHIMHESSGGVVPDGWVKQEECERNIGDRQICVPLDDSSPTVSCENREQGCQVPERHGPQNHHEKSIQKRQAEETARDNLAIQNERTA